MEPPPLPRRAFLVATTEIPPFTELTWSYGVHYPRPWLSRPPPSARGKRVREVNSDDDSPKPPSLPKFQKCNKWNKTAGWIGCSRRLGHSGPCSTTVAGRRPRALSAKVQEGVRLLLASSRSGGSRAGERRDTAGRPGGNGREQVVPPRGDRYPSLLRRASDAPLPRPLAGAAGSSQQQDDSSQVQASLETHTLSAARCARCFLTGPCCSARRRRGRTRRRAAFAGRTGTCRQAASCSPGSGCIASSAAGGATASAQA